MIMTVMGLHQGRMVYGLSTMLCGLVRITMVWSPRGDVATPRRTRALANAVKRPKLGRLLRRRQLLPELDAIRQHRPKVLLRLRLLALLLRLRLLRRLRLLGVANSQAHHDSWPPAMAHDVARVPA